MADDVREFFRRIQLRPNVVSGHISGVTVNQDTGQQEYATVAVGGNTLRIKLDASAPLLANGDQVRLEQYGYAASAEYRLAGIEAGGRPGAGVYQVLNNETSIGGRTYAGGDVIFGQLAGGNLYVEHATGRLYHRIGTEVYGIEYPDGSQLFGRALVNGGDWQADGANVFIAPSGVRLRDGMSDALIIDGIEGIRQYSGGVQRSHFRQDGSGWLGGPDKLWWDDEGNLNVSGALTTAPGSSINGGDIVARSITADRIATGTITASEIAANTITAAKLDVIKLSAITADMGTLNASELIQVGSGANRVRIDGASALIESSNFASGTSGWCIDSLGNAEFENVTARGAIKTAVFQKSLVTAFAGSQMISKSASTLIEDVTLGATFTIKVKKQAGAAPFANGDLIYIKTETLATYAAITNAGSDLGTGWQYSCSYKSGNGSGTVKAGETVLDFGPNGVGRLYMTADAANAPFLSIATHDMAATPVWTERVRLGNLTGISGASGYGLWTDNGFFTGTIDANAGHIGTLDVDGILTLATGGELRQGTVTSGTLTGPWPLTGFTGLRIWNDGGIGRIGGYNQDALQWYATSDGKLGAGADALTVDANGLSLNQTGAQVAGSTVKFSVADFMGREVDTAYKLGGHIYGLNGGDGGSNLYLKANAIRYNYPPYGWLSSGARITLWAKDEISAAEAILYVGTKAADGEHMIHLDPGVGKKIKLNGATTLTGPLAAVRDGAQYASRVLVASGHAKKADFAQGITTAWQDMLTVTQTLPAGTLAIQAKAEFQLASASGLCEMQAQLVLDGSLIAYTRFTAGFQWALINLPLNWVGSVSAGTHTWKIQCRYKDGSHSVSVGDWTAITWQHYA